MPRVGHVTAVTFERRETRCRHHYRQAAAAAAVWEEDRGRPKICVSPAGAVRRERTEGRGEPRRRHRGRYRHLWWLEHRRPGGRVAPTSVMNGRCAQHGGHAPVFRRARTADGSGRCRGCHHRRRRRRTGPCVCGVRAAAGVGRVARSGRAPPLRVATGRKNPPP